jgi:excisionase family DNA binding protein
MEKITISIKEAADLIGVSTSTMYTMVRENQIPHKKVRSRILFSREQITSWLRGDVK